MPGTVSGLAIQIDQRRKRWGSPPMIATVSGNPSIPARTNEFGVPPTPNRIGSTGCTGRGHTPCPLSEARCLPSQWILHLVAELQQQVELLREELVVVLQVVAKERIRLDERTSSDDNLGATVRDEVERREVLKDAHRVVRAEHRDGAGEANLFVRVAAAASRTAGELATYSSRWCSPMPKLSRPTRSASLNLLHQLCDASRPCSPAGRPSASISTKLSIPIRIIFSLPYSIHFNYIDVNRYRNDADSIEGRETPKPQKPRKTCQIQAAKGRTARQSLKSPTRYRARSYGWCSSRHTTRCSASPNIR